MNWPKAELMFPNNKVFINGKYITIKELRQKNYDFVELTLNKPVKSMLEDIEKIVYYENGDIDRYFLYHIFNNYYVDDQTIFNNYGQKIYNDLTGNSGFLDND